MEPILLNITDSVAQITLNRPEVYNSFNGPMAKQLQIALDECRDNPSVRAVYITGAGKAFCAGQDLQEILGEDSQSLEHILQNHLNPIINRIMNMEKPIVCGVNGVAAGAGANIAIACDITVACHAASFIQAFINIGLIPDSGGTYLLPRLVGWQRAAALMMLGEKVSAEEALHMGMIYKVFPDKKFNETALAIATQLAQKPTAAIGLIKRALNYSFTNDLDKQLAIEEQLQATAGLTEDYKEGVQAFVEKRKAVFKGR